MQRAMALLDLIEDLKKATRSDSKLDEALAIVAGYKRVAEANQSVKWIAPGEKSATGLPAFTKNIDAACKFIRILSPATDLWGCSWEPDSGTAKVGDGPFCIAANPAIALCISALAQKVQTETK